MGTSEHRNGMGYESLEHAEVVIIGAGHGGATAVSLLRQQGFSGSIALLSDETVLPYHRPPLSKQLLNDDRQQVLFPKSFFEDQGISLMLGKRATDIDAQEQRVRLDDGSQISYEHLVLATGVSACTVEELNEFPENVHTLRSQLDANALSEQLQQVESITIIGGGWVGLEVAAVARQAGKRVTVVTRGNAVLSRVASVELATRVMERHQNEGVEFILGETVVGASGRNGAVNQIQLSSGRRVDTELVLAGIGSEIDLTLARTADLATGKAIIVDKESRTSNPRIYAIGDITEREFGNDSKRMQFESIPSAVEQAKQCSHAIAGVGTHGAEPPWFWSDQYDLKIQIVGMRDGVDRTVTREYLGEEGHCTVFHVRAGRLVCVESVNTPADFIVGKRLIAAQCEVTPMQLADVTFDLPQLLGAESSAGNMAAEERLSGESFPGPAEQDGLARATFVTAVGEVVSIDIAEGHTLMEGATKQNVPGIIAECGGMATCGTCHVYVDEPWFERLPEPDYDEDVLIEFIEHQRPNSRLACQLIAEKDTDGIVVRVAKGDI